MTDNHSSDQYGGLADMYDAYRPQTPKIIPDILTQLAQVKRPKLVVDLGSGPGFSTFAWAKRAKEVVGVDRSDDMRRVAEKSKMKHKAKNVRFIAGTSSKTNLPDGCADIVTCSQSFHWMEPNATLSEIARILRDGGIFAAYDYDRLPIINAEIEQALTKFWTGLESFRKKLNLTSWQKWEKQEHIARMQASGHFRYVREIHVNSVEKGNTKRLAGFAQTFGSVKAILKHGFTEKEIGLDKLRSIAEQVLGKELKSWFFSYAVRIGVK
jgi:ubiquinone/menaquinone biosynthesis C-methylase UbiE